MPRLELSDQWDRRNCRSREKARPPFPYCSDFKYCLAAKKRFTGGDQLREASCRPATTVQDFAAGVNAVSTSRTSIFATFAPSLIPAFATSA